MIRRFAQTKRTCLGRRLLKSFAVESSRFKVGQKEAGFELVSSDWFGEFEATLLKFKHTTLDTTHYHVLVDDENLASAFLFRTTPEDNTGKSLILEKLIQCGSKKFPVRDPFSKMAGRSMGSTSETALTGPDFTGYSFGTVNQTDFRNLLDLHCEALFDPMLERMDFLNEGWRFEFTSITNPSSSLRIRGKAYNESKTLQFNQSSFIVEEVFKHFFRGTPYQHSAAGSPQDMPSLSFEELVDYYKRTYHPSNLTLYSYGSVDPREQQQFLSEKYFHRFAKLDRQAVLHSRPAISKPLEVTLKMPQSGEMGTALDGSTVLIAFLCNDLDKSPQDTLGLNILSTLLFETPASPFYVGFLANNQAKGYSPGYGYEPNLLHTYFNIGLKQVKPGTEKQVEAQLMETLERVVKEGFDKEMVESVLYQIELQSRLPRKDFGLLLFNSYVGAINHNVDDVIKHTLEVNKSLKTIREQVRTGRKYFEGLIKKYFLENRQRIHFTFLADKDMMYELERRELKFLQDVDDRLTEVDRANICTDSAHLKEELVKPQTIEVLPCLKLKDFPVEARATPVHAELIDGVETVFIEKPTNGTTHIRLKISLDSLDKAQIGFLHLISKTFNRIGTFTLSFDHLDELLQKNTTGTDFQVHFESDTADASKVKGFALITIGCLDRNINKTFEVLIGLLTEPDFKDLQHLSRLIKLESASSGNQVATSPLDYAIDYSQGLHRPAKQLCSRLNNERFLCHVAAKLQKSINIKQSLQEIEMAIQTIFHQIMKRHSLSFAVHTSKDNREDVKSRLAILLSFLKSTYVGFDKVEQPNRSFEFENKLQRRYVVMPSQLNHIVESFATPEWASPVSAHFEVLAELMNLGHLGKLLRERNGAEFGGASFDPLNATLSIYSARDPHTLQAYEHFERVYQLLADGKFTDDDVERAKLALFSRLDGPRVAHNSGLRNFLFGITAKMNQQRRARLLEVSKADLQDVLNSRIMADIEAEKSGQTIFGLNQQDLHFFVTRGWTVERFIEGLSLNEHNYSPEHADPNAQQIGKEDIKSYWLL